MYCAPITRANPTAFIILIDQSGSMCESTQFNSQKMSKAQAVATVTNMLISELIYRCQREYGVADYFEIAVLGYSGDGVVSLLDSKEVFKTISTLAMEERPMQKITKERRVPSGETVFVSTQQTCWIEPHASGATPMCEALDKAYLIAKKWCARPKSKTAYPLTIFNITDGESSDGDHSRLVSGADKIKELSTDDGNVLLFNIHISSNDQSAEPIVFPCSPSELPQERYTHTLYQMSSEMPPQYNANICDMRGESTRPPFRGMSYNLPIASLFSMMNIGSISVSVMQ